MQLNRRSDNYSIYFGTVLNNSSDVQRSGSCLNLHWIMNHRGFSFLSSTMHGHCLQLPTYDGTWPSFSVPKRLTMWPTTKNVMANMAENKATLQVLHLLWDKASWSHGIITSGTKCDRYLMNTNKHTKHTGTVQRKDHFQKTSPDYPTGRVSKEGSVSWQSHKVERCRGPCNLATKIYGSTITPTSGTLKYIVAPRVKAHQYPGRRPTYTCTNTYVPRPVRHTNQKQPPTLDPWHTWPPTTQLSASFISRHCSYNFSIILGRQ